jgi:hypothetical protein
VYYRVDRAGSLSDIGRSHRKLEAQWRSMQLHIGYLRSLEDSERVREACIKYLQNWMVHFYPERLDIFEQAEQLARDLGGQLQIPRLSWKYSWIEKFFGLPMAKRAQLFLPAAKASVLRQCDHVLLRVEGRRHQAIGEYENGNKCPAAWH